MYFFLVFQFFSKTLSIILTCLYF